ncbi:hypothetical protein BJ138DRAFT_1005353, partial [Hygrophoropsis aurantiaca]
SILKSKNFRSVLRVPTKDSKNLRYLNHNYRGESLAYLYAQANGLEALMEQEHAKNSVCVRYALGVLEGKYDGSDVFTGLVKATVLAQERREKGKGLQNFQYDPSYEEFAHMCAIISPETYRLLSRSFQMPTQRNLQLKRSRTPRYPTSICERSFQLAEEYIQKLSYKGPMALSCDDTKLHPSFRTYWDPAMKCHFVVGGVGEPYAVADVDELNEFLRTANEAKATKIRLWCLQIPLGKIPPLIIAAKAIPNSLDAPQLASYSLKLIEGLLDREIIVVSYACDGTAVERSVQAIITEEAPRHTVYTFKHPFPSRPNIILKIPTFNGHPVVMIQDSKHALKTARNNMFTGARILSLGNHVAMYSYARDTAIPPDGTRGPLYHRDVEKLDRQDDNAATRLFSAGVMDFMVKKYPHRIGQIAYLFIFGELVDAYQNRKISHCERIKMVLRARFFLEMWRSFIDAAGYAPNRHYISHEAHDIMHILHVFAECRKLVKDFTYLDFLYMIPRLMVLIRTAVNFCHSNDPRARASGYAHTYFDATDADLVTLAMFPTDDEINEIAQFAYQESTELFSLLGVLPQDFLSSGDAHQVTRLPGISSWFYPGKDPDEGFHLTTVGDDESENEGSECEGNSDACMLQGLIDCEEETWLRSSEVDDKMLSLTCASIAINLDESMQIRNFPDPSADEEAQWLQEDTSHISNAMRVNHLPQPNIIDSNESRHLANHSPSYPAQLDFSKLVYLRRVHETARAASSNRTYNLLDGDQSTQVNDSKEPAGKQEKSTRQQIIRQMTALLREYEDDRGIGTGLERQKRWIAANENRRNLPSSQTEAVSQTLAGNAANAVLAAGQRAATVIRRRLKLFSQHWVPQINQLADALVGVPNSQQRHHELLVPGNYGIVIVREKLFIGKVLAIYSQGGGKFGAHSWQPSVKSIGSVSYIAMQIYEYAILQQFRAIHQGTASLQAVTFAHVPSDHFLRRLSGRITLSTDGRSLELEMNLFSVFAELLGKLPAILAAVKSLNVARKQGKKADTGNEEDD